MSINRVFLTGNITREPELRQTKGGTEVLNLGLAVNDRHKSLQTGQWEDHANFLDCVFFGPRAAGVAPYLHKGMKVVIEGKLRYSTWERDGQRRSRVEVVVEDIEFMDSRQSQSTPEDIPF